jgi:hypothetical protein
MWYIIKMEETKKFCEVRNIMCEFWNKILVTYKNIYSIVLCSIYWPVILFLY